MFNTYDIKTAKPYHSIVGSTDGGNDVVDTTNVGVVNHAHFGSLTLHSGHKYYATVTGNCAIKVKKNKTRSSFEFESGFSLTDYVTCRL